MGHVCAVQQLHMRMHMRARGAPARARHPLAHELPLLCHLLDLRNELLLLVLQAHALAIQLTHRLVQHALVLPQYLCGIGNRSVLLKYDTLTPLAGAPRDPLSLPAGVFFLPNSACIMVLRGSKPANAL